MRLISIAFLLAVTVAASGAEPNVTVTILTTNAADLIGQGEWSFAAWVEVDEKAYLFDTGWSPRNVLTNAEALGIDLSKAEDLILSHHHDDHTGGLKTLRAELTKRNPKALSRIHVAKGIFTARPRDGGDRNAMIAMKKEIEDAGAQFFVYDRPTEIAPNVWVTGPVPRTHDEKNYPRGPDWMMQQGDKVVADNVPESQSLVLVAAEGPIVISGCGHAGLINTLEHVHARVSRQSPQAAIGGFHLYGASDKTLLWTAKRLATMELDYFLGSHCTGFESVFRIRDIGGMTRERARVGAIGTKYISGHGIEPGRINR